jgi:hypothetical protein
MEIITLEDLKKDPRAKRLNLDIIKAEAEPDIEKGHIYEAIRYGKLGEQNVQKTGKEINALLSAAKLDLDSKKVQIITLQSEIKKQIGLECDDSYSRSGVSYNRYSYSLIESLYPVDLMGNKVYSQSAGTQPTKPQLCEQHNSLIYKMREIDEDLLTLQALDGVFEENKKYDLQLKTLVELMKKED